PRWQAARGPRLGVRERPILGRLALQGVVLRRVRPGNALGSVANARKQESLGSQDLDFPRHDFWILPRKGYVATEPVGEPRLPPPRDQETLYACAMAGTAPRDEPPQRLRQGADGTQRARAPGRRETG